MLNSYARRDLEPTGGAASETMLYSSAVSSSNCSSGALQLLHAVRQAARSAFNCELPNFFTVDHSLVEQRLSEFSAGSSTACSSSVVVFSPWTHSNGCSRSLRSLFGRFHSRTIGFLSLTATDQVNGNFPLKLRTFFSPIMHDLDTVTKSVLLISDFIVEICHESDDKHCIGFLMPRL